jgi:hypothetical protein
MAVGRSETDAEGVILAVKIVLTVVGTVIIEALVASGVAWPDWLAWVNWWSGPLALIGLVWGGFWFCMWALEVATDA